MPNEVGRPRYHDKGQTLAANFNKFVLQRYDPGVGPVDRDPVSNLFLKDKTTWAFEGHIISINDTSSPSWATNFDSGRPDPKVMYSQFSRNIDISFLVVAVNKIEHDKNYDMLSNLGRMTYPIVKKDYGYNAPHVMYKIDELMKGFGVITNLSYVWDPTTSPWLDNKPLYTEVNISIMNLADPFGKRPNADSSIYLFKKRYSK